MPLRSSLAENHPRNLKPDRGRAAVLVRRRGRRRVRLGNAGRHPRRQRQDYPRHQVSYDSEHASGGERDQDHKNADHARVGVKIFGDASAYTRDFPVGRGTHQTLRRSRTPLEDIPLPCPAITAEIRIFGDFSTAIGANHGLPPRRSSCGAPCVLSFYPFDYTPGGTEKFRHPPTAAPNARHRGQEKTTAGGAPGSRQGCRAAPVSSP
jgi:hypothetical protein